MRRLVLDVDALVHARRPELLPEIEVLIIALPDRAYIERSVYHHDAARSGLLPLLDRWRADGLLRDLVDYRDLPGGERRFRELGNQKRWKRLSRRDLATLVLAVTFDDSAVLTGERLLAAAARQHRVIAIAHVGEDGGAICSTSSDSGCVPGA